MYVEIELCPWKEIQDYVERHCCHALFLCVCVCVYRSVHFIKRLWRERNVSPLLMLLSERQFDLFLFFFLRMSLT